MKTRSLAGIVLAIMAIPVAAQAELRTVSDGGFTTSHSISTSADPQAVYAAMQKIGEWWHPDHSWSGDPNNLYLDARPGGCYCERLPDGGGVEHLRIIYLAPGSEIRFNGALGPLQGMAINGRMIWKIEPVESGSTVSFTYHVMGFMDGGFEGLAPAVDGVIGEQLQRLGAFLTPPSD